MKGYKIKLTGVNQHRIYKLAQKNKIKLQNLEKIDYKTLFFDIKAGNLKNLIAICEKNNYNVSIVKRYGLILLFESLKQKIGIVIGAFLLIILSIFSTNFVWRVKIYGVSEKKYEEVSKILINLNIKTFSPNNKQHILSAEKEILNNVKGLSQVSVSVKGTTVIINVKQAVLKEDVLGSES